jgi:hypothetical protein
MIELADIIAPVAPPPAPPSYEWIALGAALFALVLFFVLRRWLKRTRARRWARAALKRTARELQQGALDARAAVFEIARALRDVCLNSKFYLIHDVPTCSQNPSQPPFVKGRGPLQAVSRGCPPLKKGGWGDLKRVMNFEMLNKRLQQSTSPSLLIGEEENSLSAEAWSDFLQELDRARFSPHPLDTQQAAQLLAQAQQWIGRVS